LAALQGRELASR